MQKMILGGCALLVGCGGVTPMSGDYAMTITVTTNTCGELSGEEVGEEESFDTTIVFNEDGSVVIDGDDDLGCVLEGATMTCDILGEELGTGEEAGMDYVLTMDAAISLEWDTSTTAAGEQTTTLQCDGADCDALNEMLLGEYGSTLPCSSTSNLTAEMPDAPAE